MELKQTIKAKCHVTASLDEAGEVRIKTFAEAEYAPGMTTTVEVSGAEVPADQQDAVKAALAAVLTGAQPKLGERIGAAIHKSAEVAASFGEI